MLLILDNCEHLIDASAELARRLLQAGPHLKILTSSREPLRIAGETIYPVPALATPDAIATDHRRAPGAIRSGAIVRRPGRRGPAVVPLDGAERRRSGRYLPTAGRHTARTRARRARVRGACRSSVLRRD